jgi:DNA (cytosine-5)-methyltransferase 1
MTLWLCSKGSPGNLWGGATRRFNLSQGPCQSIQAKGIAADKIHAHWIEDDGKPEMKPDSNKPPYCVPSMEEIKSITPNGYKVASTFSGAGGSCTGYRMAGYRVVWANEFVPAAQNSYKANAAPDSILDGRDVKTVTAADILTATGLQKGELDLFDGSPPCQAFSTAGKREKGWGKDKQYEHGARQKNEELFTEYIRLLDGLQPKVFVAENVSGLIKGTAKGFFLEILQGLKDCGYNVKTRLLDAQWLGVPQQRQRIIFVGVRNDLGLAPVFPKPLSYRYSVRDACPDIGKVIHDTSGLYGAGNVTERPSPAVTVGVNSINSNHFQVHTLPPSRLKAGAYGVRDVELDAPSPTVTIASPGNDLAVPYLPEDDKPCRPVTGDDSFGSRGIVKRKFTIAELKRICAFPDDFILTGSYAQQWERLGNSVPPVMMYHIAKTIQTEILDKLQ